MANEEAKQRLAFAFDEAFRRELEAIAHRRNHILHMRPLPSDFAAEEAAVPPIEDEGVARNATPVAKSGELSSGKGEDRKRAVAQGAARSPSDLVLFSDPQSKLPVFRASEFKLTDSLSGADFAKPTANGGTAAQRAEAEWAPEQAQEWQPGEPLTGADRLNLTGMCLSGGGVRSAAVCLGVLQGVDALSPAGRSDVIDRLDYLSTVSGGNYIGTAVAAGMLQPGGGFPFESKTDAAETPETQHLRDHANYLMPEGFVDLLANLFNVIRGILSNFLVAFVVILLLSVATIAINPNYERLTRLDVFGMYEQGLAAYWPQAFGHFVATPIIATLVAVLMIIMTATRKWIPRDCAPALSVRERMNARLGYLMLGIGVFAFMEWQPVLLLSMFQAAGKAAVGVPADAVVRDASAPAGISDFVAGLFEQLGASGHILGPAVVALLAAANKILTIAKASAADSSKLGMARRYLSKAGLILIGISLPILLWMLYLNLSYYAITDGNGGYGHAPAFLIWLSEQSAFLGKNVLFDRIGEIGRVYVALALLLGGVVYLFGPNASSLNQLYRDRLSRAFLMWRDAVRQGLPSDEADTLRFSSLKPKGAATAAAAFAPYLVVSTAINLQGAKLLNRRGRNADVFVLGPIVSGSDATGFVPTPDLERVEPSLTLATGMAISGAALSANMGGNTIRPITFTLAMLNIRLGYWLSNPKRLTVNEPERKRESGFGPWWFARELFGRIRDDSKRIYLTDGGHIENLGLHELVKRRCRVIIAVDAEADQGMGFSSFVKAQMLARIDHGVRILLPWSQIAVATRKASKAMANPDDTSLLKTTGPHVAVGRIIYRKKDANDRGLDVHGVLIYIKSSLTGDENDLLQDYKYRKQDFPHETTLDQFFSEEQFEVYRALGFHMAHGFFSAAHDAAFWTSDDPADRAQFLSEVRNALLSLGIAPAQAQAIIERARKGMATASP